jgi:hypothetical protein
MGRIVFLFLLACWWIQTLRPLEWNRVVGRKFLDWIVELLLVTGRGYLRSLPRVGSLIRQRGFLRKFVFHVQAIEIL